MGGKNMAYLPAASPETTVYKNSLVKNGVVRLEITPGKFEPYTLPLKAGSYEHLSAGELRELAFFLRLKSRRSDHTVVSYARQLEKFIFWLKFEGYTAINEMVLTAYQDALADPSAALQANGVVTFQPGEPKSVDNALAPIRSFVSHLYGKKLLAVNYGKLVPRLGSTDNGDDHEAPKCFTERQWGAVLATLDAMAYKTAGEKNRAERLRFTILFAYGMGLRIGEQANHTHQAITRFEDQWYLKIQGKGKRKRKLLFGVVDTIAWDALTRYRRFLKLPAEPNGEPVALLPARVPVVIKTRGPNRGITIKAAISARTWQQLFEDFLRHDVMAYLYPDACDDDKHTWFTSEWSHLTPHSLRHTRATTLVERCGKDLPFVAKYLGHANTNTTMQYFHPVV
jgi:site-specific recombinase XerD